MLQDVWTRPDSTLASPTAGFPLVTSYPLYPPLPFMPLRMLCFEEASCEQKAEDFAERSKLREGELVAISKAGSLGHCCDCV